MFLLNIFILFDFCGASKRARATFYPKSLKNPQPMVLLTISKRNRLIKRLIWKGFCLGRG
jgi:hypothetical protein